MLISNIRFIPIRQRSKGHVGFIHLTYGGMAIKDVAVYERLDKTGFRLVYPEVAAQGDRVKRSVIFPIDRKTQEAIDMEVNAYLKTVKIESEEILLSKMKPGDDWSGNVYKK